ncbi:HD domain-containing protein [Planobispora takensis]|uniref:Cyanamide hydratase n=1 Tax=Planobispora takensis TaxID=1367882 RepID=A0A8J3SWX2_9ACTN|nr:HD domain-containing protein [Planobispora takensis]GII00657.1 cyanamide hydratase [Planobispora takensis]
MRLADIVIPETPAARAALEAATAYCSPALLNHSIRAYLWAAAYAGRRGIAFDAELLYVSSMFHDIGLVAEFDSHTVPFEEAGGHVAWIFCAGAGWPVERRVRASEVIVRHMWDKVDVTQDPEGHLLELSTGLDISGRNPQDWSEDLRAEILESYPRLGLAEEFTACITAQGTRKPDSLAGGFVRNGVAARIAANALDR